MRKLLFSCTVLLTSLLFTGVAMAADANVASLSGTAYIATAIGMALAAIGCGIGQGLGLKSACEGIARNPEASAKITVTLILGLAFIESLAIYAFVIDLIIIFGKPLFGV